MGPNIQLWATVGVTSLLLLAGCKSTPPQSQAPGSRASAPAEDYSDAAVERRVKAHAHYATAVVHDLNSDTDAAIEEYLKAGMLDHTDEELVMDISRRFLQLKRPEAALELLKKAASNAQAGAAIYSRLALVYLVQSKTNEAAQACRSAIKKDPASLLGYQQLAQILVQQKDYAGALEVIQNASVQSLQNPLAYIELAELCLGLNQAEAKVKEAARELAKAMLNKAGDLKPSNPLTLQRLADGYMYVGLSEKASAIYVQLLDRFPQLPGVRERLIDIYLSQEDKDKASAQLESILKDNPTNLRAHYLMGSLAYDANDMAAARDHFKKVLILNPDFEQAYYDLAGTHINLAERHQNDEEGAKEARQALEVLDQARSKFKDRFITELYTGLAFNRIKEYTNAVKHFEAAEIIARATETNRLTHGFYFQLGASYERNKQFQEAEKYLRKSIEMAPDFIVALNYLGYMWADLGQNLEEAKAMIDKAIAAEPENSAYLDSLAWVLYKMKQPKEALDYMLKAIKNADEEDAVLFDHIGDIYASLQQPEKAREAWRKSLDIEFNEKIEQKLKANTSSGAQE